MHNRCTDELELFVHVYSSSTFVILINARSSFIGAQFLLPKHPIHKMHQLCVQKAVTPGYSSYQKYITPESCQKGLNNIKNYSITNVQQNAGVVMYTVYPVFIE
jgi:hypothetical protein